MAEVISVNQLSATWKNLPAKDGSGKIAGKIQNMTFSIPSDEPAFTTEELRSALLKAGDVKTSTPKLTGNGATWKNSKVVAGEDLAKLLAE